MTHVVLSIFLGQGNGGFTLGSSTTLVPAPFAGYQFVVGDFDHDGFPDLAGQNGDDQPASLLYLWGDGRGNLTPEQVFGPQGFDISVGDINGDGLPDVIVPDRFNEISVIPGRNDRDYGSPFLLSPAPGSEVSVADVNGDGVPDIFVGGSTFLSLGDGRFAPASFTSPNGWAIADLNGDGLADLIGGSGADVLVWPGTGDPSFPGTPMSYTPTPQISASDLQIIDMDKDGHADLLSSGSILYSDSHYNFTPIKVGFTAPYVVGDFNGDGFLDIAASGRTWLGGLDRSFTSETNFLAMTDGETGAVGDFNGDGYLDIAATNGVVWYGNGLGDFYEQGEFTGDSSTGGIVVADFNHDGLPDIAVGLQQPSQVAVFINDGKGGFERSFYASGAETFGMTSGDFNHDGKTDLVVCNYIVLFATPNALVIFGK